eukprot:COSAG02_NODE_4076_length_5827_cov_4.514839_5_plen_158_part_00
MLCSRAPRCRQKQRSRRLDAGGSSSRQRETVPTLELRGQATDAVRMRYHRYARTQRRRSSRPYTHRRNSSIRSMHLGSYISSSSRFWRSWTSGHPRKSRVARRANTAYSCCAGGLICPRWMLFVRQRPSRLPRSRKRLSRQQWKRYAAPAHRLRRYY